MGLDGGGRAEDGRLRDAKNFAGFRDHRLEDPWNRERTRAEAGDGCGVPDSLYSSNCLRFRFFTDATMASIPALREGSRVIGLQYGADAWACGSGGAGYGAAMNVREILLQV